MGNQMRWYTPLMPTTIANAARIGAGRRGAWSHERSGAQLTSYGSAAGGTPRWSPDSQWIAFDSRVEGRAQVYVILADGGGQRRMTDDPSDDMTPIWSRDGRSVYFASDRSGRGRKPGKCRPRVGRLRRSHALAAGPRSNRRTPNTFTTLSPPLMPATQAPCSACPWTADRRFKYCRRWQCGTISASPRKGSTSPRTKGPFSVWTSPAVGQARWPRSIKHWWPLCFAGRSVRGVGAARARRGGANKVEGFR